MGDNVLDKNYFLECYRSKKFMYVNAIKKTLKHHQIPFDKKLKKKALVTLLNQYFDTSEPKFLNKFATKIQKFYRKHLISKFANQEDFYTLDSLENVPSSYLFWFKDSKGFTFGFDIRSFFKLVENSTTNPYNREKIPTEAILNAHELAKKRKINMSFKDNSQLTQEQAHKLYILSIFQKIDMLNVTAGGVDPNWFSNLSFQALKNYYSVLEDIWNYRAELTPQQKIKIDPQNKLFKININYILSLQYTYPNKLKLQNIILKEINTLVSSALEDTDKYTGCYYTLIALTEVSQECAAALPWLVQY